MVDSWVGHKMKNPRGRVGVVVHDNNEGRWRILTVRFGDGHTEELVLNNVGEDFETTKRWSWQFTSHATGKKEWVKWGVS